MKTVVYKLMICLGVFWGSIVIPLTAWSQSLAVIVNVGNKAEISQNDIKFIYKGQLKAFENGFLALPLNQNNDSDIRKNFLNKVVKATKAQYREYWIRKMFTGKGTPPRVVKGGDKVIKEYVSNNPSMIAYIAASSVDDSVRVVLRID
ncbi:MAG: hypothetical protein JKY67_04885 [Pseudomonadales bacterium]|nr:hypothetical protein [Pseudomonadales bacterium]